MKPYAIWALVDPERLVAHVLHAAGPNAWSDKTPAPLTWRAYKLLKPNEPFPQRLLAWCSHMEQRGVQPDVRVIERGTGSPSEITDRKIWAIKTLEGAGFEVLTSGVRTTSSRRAAMPKKNTFSEVAQIQDVHPASPGISVQVIIQAAIKQ